MRKTSAPESCPDELMQMLLAIQPPITLAETSYHQRVYECIVDYFEMGEKKPASTKEGEPSDEAKHAHRVATEGLTKT